VTVANEYYPWEDGEAKATDEDVDDKEEPLESRQARNIVPHIAATPFKFNTHSSSCFLPPSHYIDGAQGVVDNRMRKAAVGGSNRCPKRRTAVIFEQQR